MHSINNGNVYWSANGEVKVIGPETYTQTDRIDSETVEDITSTFDLEVGEYVEQSRATRSEPLPPQVPTLEERTAALEAMMNALFA
jgi:hypothetical protein